MEIASRYHWNTDTLIAYIKEHSPDIELDNDGQVVIYTGTWQRPDGSLHDTPNNYDTIKE